MASMFENRAALSVAYLAVLAGAVACYAALGAVLSLLPQYVSGRLSAGSTVLGVAVGAPALSGLLARPRGGRSADRCGPLRPVLAGAAVMAAGAVPAALSATVGALLLTRLATGFGEGLMMSANVLWLLRLAGPSRRGRALGHIGLANYAGLALGPLVTAMLGGPSASVTVFWVAAVLPLLGAASAIGAARAGLAAHRQRPASEGDHGRSPESRKPSSTRRLLRKTTEPGLGLLLVNVGYVSVLSFGAALARANATGLQTLIVPVFAVVIILTRTLGSGVADRLGGRLTVAVFAGIEAFGLLTYAYAMDARLALAALLALSVGQSLAVPGLGLLALAGVPAAEQGAAAGLFFAWFDAGVGLGGPMVGAVASLAGPVGALAAGAAAVAGAVLIALARPGDACDTGAHRA